MNTLSSFVVAMMAILLFSCSSGTGQQALSGPEDQTRTLVDNGIPFPAGATTGPRAANLATAGDYSLLLDQILDGSSASHDSQGLHLNNSGTPAWAMYMVSGFDGDMFPVSAHVEVASGSSSYLVGFTDYDNQRWTWAGPFSGSAEIDVPLNEGVNHGHRLVSDYGNSFLAVVADEPGELVISDMFLEVFGGGNAPLPPTQIGYVDDTDSIILSWFPSPDEGRPDFRGYLLERAPFNSSSYSEIARTAPGECSYSDSTVVPFAIYRYRLRAYDSAENMSLASYEFNASCGNGSNEVVAVLDMTAGPLLGPADVDIDLSGSYVIGGGSIDNYEVFIKGYPDLTGPSSKYSINLQPGCYQVVCVVHSGALSDLAVGYLRILPQWQAQSVLVDDMQGNMGTILYSRSGRLPDGSLVHAGYDSALGVVAVWTESPAGLRYHAFFAGDVPVDYSCEPVLVNGVLHFGFASSGAVQIISVDHGGSSRLLQNIGAIDNQFCLVADASDRLGIFRQIDNGGNFDLVYSLVESISNYDTVLASVAGGVKGVDAVWNPSIAAFDICYGNNIALQFEQWEPIAGHIAGGGLYNFKVLGVDLELDPTSQRSVMLTTLDVAPFEAWYLYQNESGFWSLPEKPDEGLKATPDGDLAVTGDDVYVLLQLKDGVDDYRRYYRRDDGNWPVLSEEMISTSVESELSLLPTSGGNSIAALPLKDGTCTVMEFPASGSPVVDYVVGKSADGFRGEMHAASGVDGLQVVWLNEAYDELEHYGSPDGNDWADSVPGIGKVTDIDLASTSGGEVYLSYIDVNSTELAYWNGTAWVLQKNYPGIAGYRPSLMSQPTNELMYWYVHLQPANALRFVEGNQSNPFTFVSFNPSENTYMGTVIDGGFSFVGIKPRWICLVGTSLVNSDLAFYDYNIMTPTELSIHQNSNSQFKVYGRTIDSCLFDSSDGERQCAWLTNASGLMDSIRMAPPPLGNGLSPNVVPIADPFEALIQTGIRLRSVNMSEAKGRTALALDCGLLGYDNKLFWSDFGSFTELPLPAQLSSSHGAWVMSPEIVVGTDGRWHIVYVDLRSGEVRSISTV
ncbi:MAG: fibronectin type III domain-containing protein [Planctomycetales bacterium]|nr:fibronectin type III domain-containing protein [bacterium]UNM07504.1 MAG: fibronectin type III domain-containing protein [Planctomycetales bacterium]